MFVRYRKTETGKTRVQIVENYRVGNKVTQKVLRHVGTAKDDRELEHIKKMAEYMKETIEDELRPKLFTKEQLPEKIKKSLLTQTQKELQTLVNLHNLREEKRITTGFHDIYGKLFDDIGYGNVLKSSKVSAKVFKDIVMARLSKPVSKRASCELLAENFGIEYSLDQVYRMLDSIKSERENTREEVVNIDKIPEIQAVTFQHSKRLLNDKITLFFYDCTTLYFESFTEDELRLFGYSKDLKFNQGQVLLALLVTEEGLPAGYEVFPGNMYEGDTFETAIRLIKEKYGIKEAVIVADSGLLSEKNRRLVTDSGYQYILGARLKNLSQAWQNTIVENTDYETHTIYCKDKREKEKDVLKLKDYDYNTKNGTRLIVSRSSARAKKDKADRDKALKKLFSKLEKSKNPADFISNFGYKKYLKTDGKTSVGVNEEKVAAAELWDGLHGVFTNTNRSELNAYAVYGQYHGLWQIEDCFRIDKHDLRMRPVFHWTPNRIKAHIAICFVAFSLIRFLQYHLNRELDERFSARRISLELNSVQQSILYDVNKKFNKYVIPSKSNNNVLKIYNAMKLHRNVVPYKLIE
jgi:transposase